MLLDLICKCGEPFHIETTEYLFNAGKYRKHCSRKCANARAQTKKANTARSLKLKGKNTKEKELHTCPICGVQYVYSKQHPRKSCSKYCGKILTSRSIKGKNLGSKNGMYGKSPILKQYQHGDFVSIKTGKTIRYKSSYELKALSKIEIDSSIVDYMYEPFNIPYTSTRSTIPDLLIKYKDGTQKIVEIKPKKVLQLWNNQAKIKAIEDYCRLNNLQFEVWTEENLR